MNFGNYAIIDNVKHYLEKEPNWYWEVRPPTVKDEISLARFIRNDDQPVGKFTIQIAAREVALTFASTNIPLDDEKPVEDGGKPILKSGATVEEIETVLETMPADMLFELWRAVGDAVPLWGPAKPPQGEAGGGEEDEGEDPKE